VSPVKYELGFYIPEYAVLHSYCLENLKSYIFTVKSGKISVTFRRHVLHLCSFCNQMLEGQATA
jgi:hypothetical protein